MKWYILRDKTTSRKPEAMTNSLKKLSVDNPYVGETHLRVTLSPLGRLNKAHSDQVLRNEGRRELWVGQNKGPSPLGRLK